MIGSEIGSMSIENDRVLIVETNPEMTKELKDEFFVNIPKSDLRCEYQGAIIAAEWLATIDDLLIGIGWLLDISDDWVALFVVVHPERRGVGLGKLMIKLATDMAIRHRKRVILIPVKECNDAAQYILEGEEFELTPDGTMYRKDLKWQ